MYRRAFVGSLYSENCHKFCHSHIENYKPIFAIPKIYGSETVSGSFLRCWFVISYSLHIVRSARSFVLLLVQYISTINWLMKLS
jgi:hypothetical protein